MAGRSLCGLPYRGASALPFGPCVVWGACTGPLASAMWLPTAAYLMWLPTADMQGLAYAMWLPTADMQGPVHQWQHGVTLAQGPS